MIYYRFTTARGHGPSPGWLRSVIAMGGRHMEERRREEEHDRMRALPDPEQMARQFLMAEAGVSQRPEDVAAAGERAYLQLRERLSVFLGHKGFDTLWARAMYLARQKIPW